VRECVCVCMRACVHTLSVNSLASMQFVCVGEGGGCTRTYTNTRVCVYVCVCV